MTDAERDNPEQRARRRIDAMLIAAGWGVQDRAATNLAAAPGVAIREFQTSAGPADYLFEGGAGETTRCKLFHECAVRTLLRLPTGIFYAQGVKANVLSFDRKPDLDEFVALNKTGALHERQATWSDATPDGRWRADDHEELVNRDKCSLDLFWPKDDSLLDAENLPEPDEIAAEIAEDLRSTLEHIEEILGDLGAAT